MKTHLIKLIQISRPRFWLYGLGPYLFGVAHIYAFGEFLFPWWIYVIFGLFFTFPANLLVYGVNDIFDYGTDISNPKKRSYENLLSRNAVRPLVINIILALIPFVILTGIFLPWQAWVMMVLGIVLLITYSAPPVRSKQIPFIDSIWNALMSLFGFFFVLTMSGMSFPLWGSIAGGIWAGALHAYSAVPDIFYDKNAQIQTIATFLGEQKTLGLVVLAMIASTIIGTVIGGSIVLLVGLCYILITLLSYYQPHRIMTHYKILPLVTASSGMLLFFVILFS